MHSDGFIAKRAAIERDFKHGKLTCVDAKLALIALFESAGLTDVKVLIAEKLILQWDSP